MSLNINFQNELLCRFESSRPHHHGWSLYIKHYIISKSGLHLRINRNRKSSGMRSFGTRELSLNSSWSVTFFPAANARCPDYPRSQIIDKTIILLSKIWDLSQLPDAEPTCAHETRCHENREKTSWWRQSRWLRKCPNYPQSLICRVSWCSVRCLGHPGHLPLADKYFE